MKLSGISFSAIVVLMLVVGSGWTSHVAAEDEEHDEYFDEVSDYLDISERIVDLSSKPVVAIYFAVEGIREIYEEQGNEAKAISHLEKILNAYPEHRAVRNIVLFKLRDVYKETGQADKALAELDRIIEENGKALKSE